MASAVRRGEIRWADLEPALGSEADKRRPVIIVSNDAANATAARRGQGVVTVVPVTSSVTKVYPFQVLLTAGEAGLQVDSKAQAEQVREISSHRIGPLIGQVSVVVMRQLDDALRLHLQL